MLFHPYEPVKLFGVTVWPQGMIPRHRARLAESIGNAVGNELVSQQTVFDALFETSFFQSKVEDFVGVYTNDMLAKVYPSFIDALPSQARPYSRHHFGAAVSAGGIHRGDAEKRETRPQFQLCRSPD